MDTVPFEDITFNFFGINTKGILWTLYLLITQPLKSSQTISDIDFILHLPEKTAIKLISKAVFYTVILYKKLYFPLN